MGDLKRTDPIDEHEIKIIFDAIDACQEILNKIPYRSFSIKIIED